MRVRGLIAASLLVAGCERDPPARDQWLVTVSTDARVPSIGDGVTIELLDESGAVACPACARTFSAAELPLSFGVEAGAGVVRARSILHRSRSTGPSGAPRGPYVEVVLRLPPAAGVTRVSLPLATRCFRDEGAPGFCDPGTGLVVDAPALALDEPPLVTGSEPALADLPCTFAVPDGAICVPGGALVLGTSEATGPGTMSGSPEHLVRVSPFALDRTEVTWGELDALVANGLDVVVPCDRESPSHPARCLSRPQAEKVCEAKGGRLPTEAEWELAAGNRWLETRAPWGDDLGDVCARAVVARGGLDGDASCRALPGGGILPTGPAPVGSYHDETALGIVDMAGNVSEWVADAPCAFDGPYWSALPQLALDPRCPSGPGALARGGHFAGAAALGRASTRLATSVVGPALTAGVRCAHGG